LIASRDLSSIQGADGNEQTSIKDQRRGDDVGTVKRSSLSIFVSPRPSGAAAYLGGRAACERHTGSVVWTAVDENYATGFQGSANLLDRLQMLGSPFSILTKICRLKPARLATSSWLSPKSALPALRALMISDVESMDSKWRQPHTVVNNCSQEIKLDGPMNPRRVLIQGLAMLRTISSKLT